MVVVPGWYFLWRFSQCSTLHCHCLHLLCVFSSAKKSMTPMPGNTWPFVLNFFPDSSTYPMLFESSPKHVDNRLRKSFEALPDRSRGNTAKPAHSVWRQALRACRRLCITLTSINSRFPSLTQENLCRWRMEQ